MQRWGYFLPIPIQAKLESLRVSAPLREKNPSVGGAHPSSLKTKYEYRRAEYEYETRRSSIYPAPSKDAPSKRISPCGSSVTGTVTPS